MKIIYKLVFSILFILLLIYFTFAQTQTTDDDSYLRGRIVVSTHGASVGTTISQPSMGAVIPTDFLPLPKNRCDIVVASSIWQGMGGGTQAINLSEAKNTTASRNVKACFSPSFYGSLLCDHTIHLDDEYYLFRVDFANPPPYFTVSYQCKWG